MKEEPLRGFRARFPEVPAGWREDPSEVKRGNLLAGVARPGGETCRSAGRRPGGQVRKAAGTGSGRGR